MYSMLSTKNSGRDHRPHRDIARMGHGCEDLELLSMIGLPNVGLSIIIMTILVNVV